MMLRATSFTTLLKLILHYFRKLRKQSNTRGLSGKIKSNVITGTIDRHPKNDLQKFIIGLNASLEKLKNYNTMYLIGDFDVNLALTDDTNSLSNLATAYIDMLTSNVYFPIISLPTRVNDHSASIIDYIVSNDHLHRVSHGIIKCI